MRAQGFTIVELLVVIVVTGILASVTVVACSGVQKNAQVATITSELKQWYKLFESYKATYGNYPPPVAPPADPLTSGGPGSSALNWYCLGTGFPSSRGDNWCAAVSPTSIYRVNESTGSYLLSELSKVGVPPQNSKKYVFRDNIGPWFWYISSSNVRLYAIYPGGITCPAELLTGNSYTDRQDCYIRLNYTTL